jgi:hypothetical protein
MYIAGHKDADRMNIVAVKCKKLGLVGVEVVTAVTMECSVFWDITPCSLVIALSLLDVCFMPLCISALKMEADVSRKRRLAHRNTRRYIPEDIELSRNGLVAFVAYTAVNMKLGRAAV